jgi:hypothetical protein
MPADAPVDPQIAAASRRRTIDLWVGIGLVVVAIAIDPLRGRPVSLGAPRIVAIILGALLALRTVAQTRPRLRRGLAATAALTIVTYLCLLVVELGLAVIAPPGATKATLVDLRYRSIEDPHTGFRNAPNWKGMHDDGILRIEYRHNSRGDRDDEALNPAATQRVLLVGDSFTYGQALEDDERIDRRIEIDSNGAIDAYSIGVSGYSAIHALRRFEQSDWWRGDDVVYLWFRNDLHSASRALDYIRIYDGYPVMRRRPDGQEFTDEQLAAQLATATTRQPNSFGERAMSTFALARIRAMLAGIFDSELRLTAMPSSDLDPAIIDEVVAASVGMQARAQQQGARFHLLVLPGPIEATAKTWSKGTTQFIDKAKAAGLAPIEDLMGTVGPDDYYIHDGHFSPTGAQKAAQAITKAITAPR